MSDVGASIADNLPLPVYAFTKDLTEAIARKGGMDPDGARSLGIAVGAVTSLFTACTTGIP